MNRFLRCMPLVFFSGLALVTVMSLVPGTSLPQTIQFWDKAQHALSYLALSVTGCIAFSRRIAGVCAGLLAHGAMMEVLQGTLSSTRVGSGQDWLADAIGVLAGVVIFHFVMPASAAARRRKA